MGGGGGGVGGGGGGGVVKDKVSRHGWDCHSKPDMIVIPERVTVLRGGNRYTLP